MISLLARHAGGALLRERSVQVTLGASLLLLAALAFVQSLPGADSGEAAIIEWGWVVQVGMTTPLALALSLATGSGQTAAESAALLRGYGVRAGAQCCAWWLGCVAIIALNAGLIGLAWGLWAQSRGVAGVTGIGMSSAISQTLKAALIVAAGLLWGGALRSGLAAALGAVAWMVAAYLRGWTDVVVGGGEIPWLRWLWVVPDLSLFEQEFSPGTKAAPELGWRLGYAAIYVLGYLSLATWAWSQREVD